MFRFLTAPLVLGCLAVNLGPPQAARGDGPDTRPALVKGDPVDPLLARDAVGKILVAQQQSARTELQLRYEALAVGGRKEQDFTALAVGGRSALLPETRTDVRPTP